MYALSIWDRGGPSTYFVKFSKYYLFKETSVSSTTAFLRSLSIMALQGPEFLITRTFLFSTFLGHVLFVC